LKQWMFYKGKFNIEVLLSAIPRLEAGGGDSLVLASSGAAVISRIERRSQTLQLDGDSVARFQLELPSILEEISADFECSIRAPAHWRINKYAQGDFFTPHRDRAPIGGAINRHLTMVVGLSSTPELIGGRLELIDLPGGIWGRHTLSFALDAGDFIVFNSNLLHGVTNIESGVRHTLVGFLEEHT
jgi:predicted 2-oxoglutarate/Fe(II)-dependent dioxygenase YbiX